MLNPLVYWQGQDISILLNRLRIKHLILQKSLELSLLWSLRLCLLLCLTGLAHALCDLNLINKPAMPYFICHDAMVTEWGCVHDLDERRPVCVATWTYPIFEKPKYCFVRKRTLFQMVRFQLLFSYVLWISDTRQGRLDRIHAQCNCLVRTSFFSGVLYLVLNYCDNDGDLIMVRVGGLGRSTT